MSIQATDQRRNKPIHVKPVVEYSAAARPPQNLVPPRPRRRMGGEVIGLPIGLIREGSAVICRDGKAGRVARVVVHPQRGNPTHIIVRHGRLRSRQFRVALNWMTGIAPDYVELSLSKAELMQQLEYRPDDVIAGAVEDALHEPEADHAPSAYFAIRATVTDGSVTLRGNVRDSTQRLAAERIVNRIRGVIGIHNFLSADDEIEWNTGWVLRHDPRLQIRNLQVETCLGVIRLQGQIASESQRALVTTIVKQVPGVPIAHNGLVIAAALEQPPTYTMTAGQQRKDDLYVP